MQQRQISAEELTAHSLSFNDYNARLFKGKSGLYRGITVELSQLYRDLFQQGIVQSLVAKKLLVETELTDLAIAKYQLVLQHRQLPFVSYPWEWCDLMLKDAALVHLDFCLELARYDLTTGDGHPLNILFDGCQPIFIDFGSIEAVSAHSYWAWPAYEQFCHFFLNPLKLMAEGKGRVARWLLHDYERGVLNEDLEALTHWRSPKEMAKSWLKQRIPRKALLAWKQLGRKCNLASRTAIFQGKELSPPHDIDGAYTLCQFLTKIRQEIIKIDLSLSNQSDLTIDWIERTQIIEKQSNRQEKVREIVSQLQVNSLLEIDNYQSEPFATIAASLGTQVVFLTSQEHRARQLYLDARAKRLYILPLMFDFTSPSCDLANRWYNPASDRISCDLVLGLNLVDRLVFKQYLTFETIVERLAIFSDRWLIVDFITREYPYRLKWSEDFALRFTWYRLDNFITSLKSKFTRVDILENGSDTRVLLLCEK